MGANAGWSTDSRLLPPLLDLTPRRCPPPLLCQVSFLFPFKVGALCANTQLLISSSVCGWFVCLLFFFPFTGKQASLLFIAAAKCCTSCRCTSCFTGVVSHQFIVDDQRAKCTLATLACVRVRFLFCNRSVFSCGTLLHVSIALPIYF